MLKFLVSLIRHIPYSQYQPRKKWKGLPIQFVPVCKTTQGSTQSQIIVTRRVVKLIKKTSLSTCISSRYPTSPTFTQQTKMIKVSKAWIEDLQDMCVKNTNMLLPMNMKENRFLGEKE